MCNIGSNGPDCSCSDVVTCNGNGTCQESGDCQCKPNYYGADCSSKLSITKNETNDTIIYFWEQRLAGTRSVKLCWFKIT